MVYKTYFLVVIAIEVPVIFSFKAKSIWNENALQNKFGTIMICTERQIGKRYH